MARFYTMVLLCTTALLHHVASEPLLNAISLRGDGNPGPPLAPSHNRRTTPKHGSSMVKRTKGYVHDPPYPIPGRRSGEDHATEHDEEYWHDQPYPVRPRSAASEHLPSVRRERREVSTPFLGPHTQSPRQRRDEKYWQDQAYPIPGRHAADQRAQRETPHALEGSSAGPPASQLDHVNGSNSGSPTPKRANNRIRGGGGDDEITTGDGAGDGDSPGSLSGAAGGGRRQMPPAGATDPPTLDADAAAAGQKKVARGLGGKGRGEGSAAGRGDPSSSYQPGDQPTGHVVDPDQATDRDQAVLAASADGGSGLSRRSADHIYPCPPGVLPLGTGGTGCSTGGGSSSGSSSSGSNSGGGNPGNGNSNAGNSGANAGWNGSSTTTPSNTASQSGVRPSNGAGHDGIGTARCVWSALVVFGVALALVF